MVKYEPTPSLQHILNNLGGHTEYIINVSVLQSIKTTLTTYCSITMILRFSTTQYKSYNNKN